MISWIITASLLFGAIPLGVAMLGAAIVTHLQRRAARR
jgi:hypothetical protein